MPYNLLLEQWVPVRRRDGSTEWIEPWRITEGYPSNPFVAFDSGRADFNSSLAQFFIGTVQCAIPAANPRDWRTTLRNPPDPHKLRRAVQNLLPVFNLDGDGPRFMQDLSLPGDAEDSAVAALLLESPGENTAKKGTDVIVKGGSIRALCPGCTALALYTLQSNAPSGGQGHRVSIRGGGPLTTIVLQDSLWETIWSNILEGTAPDPADFPSIFPWLGKTRTSESDQKTTPKHMHPFHAYWGMPRRIRVRFEPEPGRCDSCGRQSTSLARAYRAKNFGFNYSGAGWKHPLSPHRRDKKSGDWITLKGKARGFRYSDWLPLICKTEDVEPAKVIETFRENRSEAADFRIWACGFETDNMKVLGWGEGAIPVLNVSSDLWSDYVSVIRSLVAGAEYALRSLLHALKRCRGDHADGVHRLTGMAAATVEAGFWNETQPDFLEFCARVRDSTSHPDLQDLRRSWGRLLRKHAAKSFNVHSQTGAFAAVPPGRIAKAWNSLQRELAEGNPLFRKILGLPLIRKGEKV